MNITDIEVTQNELLDLLDYAQMDLNRHILKHAVSGDYIGAINPELHRLQENVLIIRNKIAVILNNVK